MRLLKYSKDELPRVPALCASFFIGEICFEWHSWNKPACCESGQVCKATVLVDKLSRWVKEYSCSAIVFFLRPRVSLLLYHTLISMKTRSLIIIISIIAVCLSLITSCKHSPIIDMDKVVPVDTTMNPIDTTTTDTSTIDTTTIGMPCDPDKIYFEKDILPLLKSNCAFSGCHDTQTAQKKVILESYASTIATADIKAFDLEKSKMYQVLVESDPKKRMPPSPRAALSAEQIQLIATWILQGALDETCDPNSEGCNTSMISFSNFVKPLIVKNCQGCHSGNAPNGGVNLENYTGVEVVAKNGRLFGAINHNTGFTAMPQGSAKLAQCDIDKIKSWIDAGATNN